MCLRERKVNNLLSAQLGCLVMFVALVMALTVKKGMEWGQIYV